MSHVRGQTAQKSLIRGIMYPTCRLDIRRTCRFRIMRHLADIKRNYTILKVVFELKLITRYPDPHRISRIEVLTAALQSANAYPSEAGSAPPIPPRPTKTEATKPQGKQPRQYHRRAPTEHQPIPLRPEFSFRCSSSDLPPWRYCHLSILAVRRCQEAEFLYSSSFCL